MEIFVVNGGGEAGLDKFVVVEIVGEDDATSGAWPIGLVEEKIAESIINGVILIELESLGLVRLRADDDVGAEIDEFAEKLGLPRYGGVARRHLGAFCWVGVTFEILQIDDDSVATGFGGGNVGFGGGFVVDVGAWIVAVGTLTVGFGGGGLIVT